MTRYVLVGTPFSTFTRSVALALHAKEQDFEQICVPPHSAEAEKHNSLGFIPILCDHSVSPPLRLTESLAILLYLDRQHPELRPLFSPTLAPTVLPERIMELASFGAGFVFPKIEFGIVKVRVGMMDQEDNRPSEEDIIKATRQGVEEFHPVLRELEKKLEEIGLIGPYCVGMGITAADCLIFPPLADLMSIKEGEILKGYPRVKAWADFFSATEWCEKTKEGTLSVGARP